jgi:hypothetical protein
MNNYAIYVCIPEDIVLLNNQIDVIFHNYPSCFAGS